jgi:hypothetical protein
MSPSPQSSTPPVSPIPGEQKAISTQAKYAAPRWKRIAWPSLTGLLLAALVICVVMLLRRQTDSRLTDPRLIGTWEPDFERTVADLRKQDPLGPKLQRRSGYYSET